jgi:hypothetical protein
VKKKPIEEEKKEPTVKNDAKMRQPMLKFSDEKN